MTKESSSRRDFLRAGLYAVGVSAGLPAIFRQLSLAQTAQALQGASEKHPQRILVVVELSGGNDGLNTVVPYGDDAYYKARPQLGIRKGQVLKLDDHFGLHSACTGLQSLFKDGKLAVVHGCGYPHPNLSHFTAMEYWHTGMPNGSAKYGWLGRYADAGFPQDGANYLANIAAQQSRAMACANHSPVVFKDPKKFGRIGTPAEQKVFETFGKLYPTTNRSLAFVNTVSQTATGGAALVRNACAEYRTLVDYGSDNDLTLDLKKVSAMIAAGLPTRIYYVSQGGYDTHAAQAEQQQLLLMYLSDALRGFIEDLERIGRAGEVAVMVFTEFGRRVGENASKGTDHGTATPMLVLGKSVKGGFHGQPPSLTDLDNGNLKMTTDFRSVYATLIQKWMGYADARTVLKGNFPTLDLFG
jgi:uncharacterized protein (DUF1501 family)